MVLISRSRIPISIKSDAKKHEKELPGDEQWLTFQRKRWVRKNLSLKSCVREKSVVIIGPQNVVWYSIREDAVD